MGDQEMSLSAQILTMEPVLKRRENGGWLALSPADAPLRIGVEGWQAGATRNEFYRARREWAALLEGYSPPAPRHD